MLSATNVTNTTADNDQLMRSAHDDAEEKNGQLIASSPPPESITEKCPKTGVESAELDKSVTPGSGDQITRRLRSADRSSSKPSESTESPNKTNTPKEGRTPRRRSAKIRIETSPNENFHRIDAKESSD
ncbi:unnamed protein product, partial [Anisakis simplex]|uniref:Uncharacterized protein n=1 Tax=Anisakis simplex TaxID=6269 RepID=A0A0M3JQH6_ANISI